MIEISVYENNIKQGSIEVKDSDSFPLALTKSASDLNDIKSRTGSFSKTFTIPATSTNNRILKYIYNANVSRIGRVEATISSNGMPFAKGYIKADQSSQRQAPDEYELTFVGDTADWFVRLQNKSIRDYDYGNEVIPSFTGIQLNPIASIPAQTNQSTLSDAYINATWKYPELFDYMYPVVSYGALVNGSDSWSEEDFRPSPFVRSILNKAFDDIGYTLNSAFFNTGIGSRLHIPFIGDEFIQPQSYVDNNSCEASLTINQVLAGPAQGVNPFERTIRYNNEISDPGGIYNTSNGLLTLNAGNYELDGSITIRFITSTPSDTPGQQDAANIFIPDIQVTFYRGSDVIHTKVIAQQKRIRVPSGAGTFKITDISDYFSFPETFLEQGTYSIKVRFLGFTDFERETGAQPSFGTIQLISNTDFRLNTTPQITKDQTYNVASTLPDLKVLDIIGGLLNMFNLQFESDSELRTVTIEPKTSLIKDVSDGVDYSQKLDLQNQINTDFIDTYKRFLRFKFKDDGNDAWLEDYKEREGSEYGSVDYDLGTSFDDGVSVLGTDYFAPTLNFNIHSWVKGTPCSVPIMWNELAVEPPVSYDFEPRILYFKGLATQPIEPFTAGNITYTNARFPYKNVITTNIPQSFMLDPGYGVSSAINILYSDGQVPNASSPAGLAKTYYRGDIAIIHHGRIITAFFRLTPSEFKDIDLFKPIYIDHHDIKGWYYINSVNDFKPTKNITTQFALVKAYNALPITEPTTITGANTITIKESTAIGGGTVRPTNPGNGKPNISDKPFEPRPTTVLHNGTGNTGIVGGGGVVWGTGLQQQSRNQHIFGQYNFGNNALWLVGMGGDNTERTNGLQLANDGRFLVHGGEIKVVADNQIADVYVEMDVDGVKELSKVHLTGNR